MLADYFLHQRGEYKSGNKLLKQLEDYFGDANKNQTLGATYSKQLQEKDEAPVLNPSSWPALLELDIALNRRLYENKSGFSKYVRELIDENLEIPQFFETNDVRKPP